MNSLNIVCATDDLFVPWCGVMLTSLRENHASTSITVYILTEGLSDENKRDLLSLENENFCILICQVKAESLKNLPIREGDHVSLATYYRLYLPDILPAEVNRIIYLDCDIIVAGDLSELMTVDCGECGIAAVSDIITYPSHPYEPHIYERLLYNPNLGYFNAGVLVIDLDIWRREEYQQRLINFISANPDRCKFHDQDALNVVFAGKWRELSLKYNLQTAYLLKALYDALPNKRLVDAAIQDVRVIHYTGSSKPWMSRNRHAFRRYFLQFQKRTPWRGLCISAKSRRTLKELCYDFLCSIGIKKRHSAYIVDYND